MPDGPAPPDAGAAESSSARLDGRSIGITADRRAEEQARLFERRGATVVHGPTMSTVDLSADEHLRRVTVELIGQPPSVVVVTTGMGLRMWLQAAAGWDLEPALKGALGKALIVARGAKASAAVKGAGLDPWWKAPHETMEEIVDHLAAHGVGDQRVALQLFDPDGHPSTDALRRLAGALVEVQVYRWLLPPDPGPARHLVEHAVGGDLDAVTFTSQPAVHQLFRIADAMGRAADLRAALNGPVLASCVGPVCAAAASDEGIDNPVWPTPPRLVAMARQVAELLGPAAGPPQS